MKIRLLFLTFGVLGTLACSPLSYHNTFPPPSGVTVNMTGGAPRPYPRDTGMEDELVYWYSSVAQPLRILPEKMPLSALEGPGPVVLQGNRFRADLGAQQTTVQVTRPDGKRTVLQRASTPQDLRLRGHLMTALKGMDKH